MPYFNVQLIGLILHPIDQEPISLTNFNLAKLLQAEIMHSDWLKTVTWSETANQSLLLQRSYIMLNIVNDICSSLTDLVVLNRNWVPNILRLYPISLWNCQV